MAWPRAGEQIRIGGPIVGLREVPHPPACIGQQAVPQFDPNGVRLLLGRPSPVRAINENDPDSSRV